MLEWIKKHPGLAVLLVLLLATIGWLAYHRAFGTAAIVGAAGGLSHTISERLRRQREAGEAEADAQRVEDEAAHERVLTELERRHVADDEIAGAAVAVNSDAWDNTDRLPPP